MTVRFRLIAEMLLAGAIAVAPGVHAQLNPQVKVLPRAAAPVPSDCDQGLAEAPAPRVTADEKAAAAPAPSIEAVAPPSGTLRGELRNAIVAEQRGDRASFQRALSRIQETLVGYPAGGERTAANDALHVLEDVDRLWDYQFTSPTGAFFDAGSDLFQVARKYAGYETYVRRQTIVDRNGNRFYPTAETRTFVAGEAASRVARLTGAALPARPEIRERAPVRDAPPSATVGRTAASRTTTQQSTIRRSGTTTPAPTQRKSIRPSPGRRRSATKPAPRRSTTEHSTAAAAEPRKVAERATTPSSKPINAKSLPASSATATRADSASTGSTSAVVSQTGSGASPESATGAMTTATSSTPPASASTGSSAGTTSTTADVAPASPTDTMNSTTEGSQPPAQTTSAEPTGTRAAAQGTRSLFWPIILILVGLGVLVLLFRASA